MLKKCTNNNCRRNFKAGPVCPHCGKEYPRLLVGKFDVVLVRCPGRSTKARTFYTLINLFSSRRTRPCAARLREITALKDTVVIKSLPGREAYKWYKELQKAGALVKLT